MSDRKPAPTSGGPTEVFLHERASATPGSARKGSAAAARRGQLRAVPSDARGAPVEPDMPAARLSLRDAQAWFAAVVTHPESAAAGALAAHASRELGVVDEAGVGRILTAGPRMSAVERIGVYHHAYRARLVECLADDYPAVQHAIGVDAFEALASDYVTAHPSRSPNLNAYGQHMAAFCRAHPGEVSHRAFVADLAALEWALVCVLHGEEAPALTPAALQAIPAERWGEARLPANPTARLLRFDYPVNAYFQAFRMEQEPAIPEASPSATAVYRQGTMIWRMDLTPAMAALLSALFAGETLGDALEVIERAAETPDALAEAERNVMLWFREWVSGGFFSGIELAAAPDAR